MKTFSLVLRVLSGILIMLIALVFTVIEAILIVTLDFALFENEFLSLLQLIFKLLLGASVFTMGLLSIIKNSRAFLWESVALLLSTIAMAPFLSNNFSLYFMLLSAFFALTHAFAFVVLKKSTTSKSVE